MPLLHWGKVLCPHCSAAEQVWTLMGSPGQGQDTCAHLGGRAGAQAATVCKAKKPCELVTRELS